VFGLCLGADVQGVNLQVRQRVARLSGLLILVAFIGTPLAVSSARAQSVDLPLPELGPLLDGLDLPNTVDNLLPDTVDDLLPNSVLPILTALDLPGSVADVVGQSCPSLPLSSECGDVLQALAVQGPAAQQVIANATAASNAQTSRQVVDFALSGILIEGLVSPSQTAAVLRTLSPSVTSFGISGVSHTSHDGFEVESPRTTIGRTPGFESLDAGITLGVRIDASKAVNLPTDSLTLGLFGNYTNSDIDVDSNAVLREFGFKNAGDATLNSGSGGGYGLLTNGKIYGLALASGEFGKATVNDGIFHSHTDFDTSGFASALFGGVVLPAGPVAKLDFRGGLNYLTARAEDHTGFGEIRFSDGRIDQFSGTLSARLFAALNYGRTVVRPFVQGGVDYRFHYENEVDIEAVDFSFDEGRTTLFGRVGIDFDIGDRTQIYLAFRADHNDDFDTVAGQAGLTFKLN